MSSQEVLEEAVYANLNHHSNKLVNTSAGSLLYDQAYSVFFLPYIFLNITLLSSLSIKFLGQPSNFITKNPTTKN